MRDSQQHGTTDPQQHLPTEGEWAELAEVVDRESSREDLREGYPEITAFIAAMPEATAKAFLAILLGCGGCVDDGVLFVDYVRHTHR